jgi:transposase
MTRHGGKIAGVSPAEVKDRLSEASNPKAVKRLVAAVEYLDGASPAAIESKFGFPEQTVYEWLDRIEERGLEAALDDQSPPGRPAELDEEQRAQVAEALERPPSAAGLDAPAWTPTVARAYLSRVHDVEFSRRHVRRLLADLDGT